MIQKIKNLIEKESEISPLKFFKQCLEKTKKSKLIKKTYHDYAGLYCPEDREIRWEE